MVVEKAIQRVCFTLFLLLADILSILVKNTNPNYQLAIQSNTKLDGHHEEQSNYQANESRLHQLETSILLLVDAKGVAGLGKAGGDGQAGSDKAGQQVPPEVYNALTYAGSAFLLTLSAPVILYSLNKLLNKIEDCFGCGPSSKKKAINEKQQSLNQQNDHNQKYKQQQQQQKQKQRQSKPLCQLSVANIDGNMSLLSQHQSIGPSTDSTAITLPLDYNLNYNASPQQHNQQQQQQQQQHRPQPYIISTPHL